MENENVVEVKRTMKGTEKIFIDLFKLEVGILMRDISWNKNPNLVPIEHCHFFRTFDSNGKKMTQCSAVAGHTHDVTVSEKMVKGEKLLVATCGPAKSGDKTHTHEVKYVRSEEIKKRILSDEAARFIDSVLKAQGQA
jgi:hypothetical protein